MADDASRLVSHKARQARLAQFQLELAAQRREEIGKLAGRLGVLETEDCVLAGLRLELKTALANSSLRLANGVMRVFRSLRRGRTTTRHECWAAPGRSWCGSKCGGLV